MVKIQNIKINDLNMTNCKNLLNKKNVKIGLLYAYLQILNIFIRFLFLKVVNEKKKLTFLYNVCQFVLKSFIFNNYTF